jgi:hypothetical protein
MVAKFDRRPGRYLRKRRNNTKTNACKKTPAKVGRPSADATHCPRMLLIALKAMGLASKTKRIKRAII